MNKKIAVLLSVTILIAGLMLLSVIGTLPVKASESGGHVSAQGEAQSVVARVICPVPYLLMHEARLIRMDFALSDGRGNALGLRNGGRVISQDPCDFKLRRLNFALSDGRGNAFEFITAAPKSVTRINGISLERLDFAWSDGSGNALGLRDEVSAAAEDFKDFNLIRLDFALSDGRGNALGLRDSHSQAASNVP